MIFDNEYSCVKTKCMYVIFRINDCLFVNGEINSILKFVNVENDFIPIVAVTIIVDQLSFLKNFHFLRNILSWFNVTVLFFLWLLVYFLRKTNKMVQTEKKMSMFIKDDYYELKIYAKHHDVTKITELHYDSKFSLFYGLRYEHLFHHFHITCVLFGKFFVDKFYFLLRIFVGRI